MTIKLSFILPTSGRPTLNRALRSILYQMNIYDEVLLITDHTLTAIKMPTTDRRVKMLHCPRSHDWGNSERRMAIPLAAGTHICILDDDDEYLEGGLEAIRGAIALNPTRPLMFKMIGPDGLILWIDKRIWVGNHGGAQLVVPNVPGKVGQWGVGAREADYDFLRSTLALYPDGDDALVWCDQVVYGCRGWIMVPERVSPE